MYNYNFLLSSLILAISGHMLIATVFLLVYAGAILVMICIAFLLTPAIKKQNTSKSFIQKINNSSDLFTKYFFYFCIFLFVITILLMYLNLYYNNLLINSEMYKLVYF